MTASPTAIEAAPLVSTDRPIIFSGSMVRAILKGHKTQTRRIINLDTLRVRLPRAVSSDWPQLMAERRVEARPGVRHAQLHDAGAVSVAAGDGWLGVKPGEFHFVCPYCGGDTHLGQYGEDDKRWTIIPEPGSRLWVRETFAIETNSGIDDEVSYPPRFNDGRPVQWHEEDGGGRTWKQCHYRATEPTHDLVDYDSEDDKPTGWKPSIFMPRWASRIDLEVVGVRVERLQEITEDDAEAEGSFALGDAACSYRAHFQGLWDNINGERAPWRNNPWVWRIEFKRVRP